MGDEMKNVARAMRLLESLDLSKLELMAVQNRIKIILDKENGVY